MTLSEQEKALLAEALHRGGEGERTFPASRFRADHGDHLPLLDGLQERGLIQREHDKDIYWIPLATLALLDDEAAKRILATLPKLYTLLREAYEKDLDRPIPMDRIADELQMSRHELARLVAYLRDPGVITSTSDPMAPDGVIVPTEKVLEHQTFEDLLDWWIRVVYRPSKEAKKKHGNAVVNAAVREQILGAALAILAKYPDECRWGGRIAGGRIAKIMDRKAPIWWPNEGSPPLEASTIADQLNNYLKTLD